MKASLAVWRASNSAKSRAGGERFLGTRLSVALPGAGGIQGMSIVSVLVPGFLLGR